MLFEFSVGNYLSFRECKTLNLVATGISDFRDSNTFKTSRHTLLKGAAIYGANSSGKSNFIRALSTMKRIVLTSFYQASTQSLGVNPYLLHVETAHQPSFFEVLLETGGVRYRYGFEVSNKAVHAEWLFEIKKHAEKPLFLRASEGIEVFGAFPEGANLESKTRENALFLSVTDQFNGPISKNIMLWFQRLTTISGLSHENYESITFQLLGNSETQPLLNDFFKSLDLGFDGIQVHREKFNRQALTEEVPDQLLHMMVKDLDGSYKTSIETIHQKFDNDGNATDLVRFDMRVHESAGTNKLFNLSGPVFEALIHGGVLAVDELDSSMHPLLLLAIIRLFHSEKDNPHHAQLIFTTHDTNLFSYGNFRRDQIYFIEKDNYGASDLYSLVEYREEDGNKIRKDRSFENDYLKGRYGAIPMLGNISKIIETWQEK